MSSKGQDEVVEIHDSSDSDAEFFTAPKIRRPLKPVQSRPVVTSSKTSAETPSSRRQTRSERIQHISDSDDEKPKKPKVRSKAASKLPDWTRGLGLKTEERQRSTKRGSTEDMADTIEEKSKIRRNISLTPPPELPKAQQERIIRLLDEHLANTMPVIPPETEVFYSSSPVSGSASSDSVQLTIRMKADPSKAVPGSENAIKHYEKLRIFQVALNQPLSVMINALAAQIQKPAESIIITLDDQRIFATGSTIERLGIRSSSQLLGYEKTVYEKLEKEKRFERARRLAELAGESPPTPQPEQTTLSKPTKKDHIMNHEAEIILPPPKPKIKLKLRSSLQNKDYKVNVELTNTVGALIQWYCMKSGRVGEEAKIKLSYDGEVLEKDYVIGELDLEDGDLVDVV